MVRKPPPPTSRYNITASIGVVGNILLIIAVATDYWYFDEKGNHGGLYRNVRVVGKVTRTKIIARTTSIETDKVMNTTVMTPVHTTPKDEKLESPADAQERCDKWILKQLPPSDEEEDDGAVSAISKNVTIIKEFEFNVCCMGERFDEKIVLSCETTTWRDIVQKMLVVGLTSYCLGTVFLFFRMENMGQNCIMAASLFVLLGDVSYTGGIIYKSIPGFASYGFSYVFAWIGWIVNVATFITWIYLNNQPDPPKLPKQNIVSHV